MCIVEETYDDAVGVTSLMLAEFLAGTEAGWAEVYSVARFAYGIGTFYTDGVSEITCTGIAVELLIGFSYYAICKPVEKAWILNHSTLQFVQLLRLPMSYSH